MKYLNTVGVESLINDYAISWPVLYTIETNNKTPMVVISDRGSIIRLVC